MNERFEALYQLPQNLYTEGAPVIVVAGSLLKDTVTGNVVAQLKYQSLSEQVIKALILDIIAIDVTGNDIPEHIEYQYLDLGVKAGQSFGSNKAIVVPNTVTRSFKINKLTVIFKNGESWCCEEDMQTIPSSELLEKELHSNELQKQYRLMTNRKAKYMPIQHKDLWCCSCGSWNRSEHCVECFLEKTKAFSAWDLDTLNEMAKARLEEEAKQEKYEKERAEKVKAEGKKRRKRTIMIVTPIAVIAMVILLFVCTKTEHIKYKAKWEIKKGNFLVALEILNDIKEEKGVTAIRVDACNGMKADIENAISRKDFKRAMELIELYSEEIRSDLYVKDVQAACPHENTYTEMKEVTCEEDGYNKVICEECGYIDDTYLRSTGHDDVVEVLKEASCSEAGEHKLTCKVCGEIRNIEVFVEHTWEKVHNKPVMCTVCSMDYSTEVELIFDEYTRKGTDYIKLNVTKTDVKYDSLRNRMCTNIVFKAEGRIRGIYKLVVYDKQGTGVTWQFIQPVNIGPEIEIDKEITIDIPYIDGIYTVVVEKG